MVKVAVGNNSDTVFKPLQICTPACPEEFYEMNKKPSASMHTILSQEQYHFEIYLKSMQKLMKQVGPKRKQASKQE